MTGSLAIVSTMVQNPAVASGLVKRLYLGYAGNNPAYFDTRTPYSTSIDSAPANQSWSGTNASGLWMGYFRPTVNGNNNIAMVINKDLAASQCFFWIGNAALSGYTANNAFLKGSGSENDNISLIAGVLYPIRLQVGFQNQGDFFEDGYLSFTLQINGSNSYNIFYNTLTMGF